MDRALGQPRLDPGPAGAGVRPALKAILNQAGPVLKTQEDLPEAMPVATKPKSVSNPFD